MCIQQGGFSKAKSTIQTKISSESFNSQKQIVEMSVVERAKTSSAAWQNNCASRRLGFINAEATESSQHGGDTYKVKNINYKLLKDNKYVQGL